jgi:ATP-binding cassette subfamily B protein
VKSQITAPPQPVALPQPARGDVGFENVSFAYPTRPDVLAIDNVSLAVKAGEKVAIVGPSGAGKSTLFHLLLRFYDPARGTISLDGVPVRSADPVDVRSRIALVPQDTVVFAASARENIRFGRPDASDAEVERAADLAHATEFLRRLPGGFEAQLGERGVTLSGGQRQRIAIARAILRDAPLIAARRSHFRARCRKRDAGADRAGGIDAPPHHAGDRASPRHRAVLRPDYGDGSGQIVEQGTHAELVAANGLYARLARLQFEGV